MENKLRKLFDFQRFQKNERLQTMIDHAEYRYNSALEDEELFVVAAAGEQQPSDHKL